MNQSAVLLQQLQHQGWCVGLGRVWKLARRERVSRVSCFCENAMPPPRVTSPVRKHSPWEPTVGLCLGSKGGPRGVGVFLWARYPCRTLVGSKIELRYTPSWEVRCLMIEVRRVARSVGTFTPTRPLEDTNRRPSPPHHHPTPTARSQGYLDPKKRHPPTGPP